MATLTEYRDGDGGLQLPVAGVHGGAAVLARVLVSQPLDEEGDGHVLGLDLGVHPAQVRGHEVRLQVVVVVFYATALFLPLLCNEYYDVRLGTGQPRARHRYPTLILRIHYASF